MTGIGVRHQNVMLDGSGPRIAKLHHVAEAVFYGLQSPVEISVAYNPLSLSVGAIQLVTLAVVILLVSIALMMLFMVFGSFVCSFGLELYLLPP